MESDVGIDSQCNEDQSVGDDAGPSDLCPPVGGTSVAVGVAQVGVASNSPELPLTAKLNKLTCDTDDPKPAPSKILI